MKKKSCLVWGLLGRIPAAIGLISSLVLLSAAPSHAGSGLETWVDACEAGDADLQALLEAEAAIVPPDRLEVNFDGSYRLLSESYEYIPWAPELRELCADSRFFGQRRPKGFPTGRSALLVAPDMILTARHFYPPTGIPDAYVVFSLSYRLNPAGECVPPPFDRIPASDVYRAVEFVRFGDGDFVLIRLDRAVEGRRLVRVRRSGQGRAGDRLTVIGHPESLAAKVDLAPVLVGVEPELEGPIVYGAHTLPGSSGSMIYNREAQLLESVVTWGSCATYQQDGDCWRLASVCYEPGIRLGDAVSLFAEHVPAFELVVTSLAEVVHDVPEGAPIPEPVTDYELAAPLTASGPLSYEVVPPADGPPGEPSLTVKVEGPWIGILAPGQGLKVLAAAAADGAPCGRYERSFAVRDLTHGYTDVLRHRFEIGLAEVAVEPSGGLSTTGLASPYAATREYVVSNLRSTTAFVEVAADRDWITLNGEKAPEPGVPPVLLVGLAPAGEPGSAVPVVVGIGGFVDDLPLGQWHGGSVRFTNVTGSCEDLGSTVREVALRPGWAALAFDQVPRQGLPIPDGSPSGLVTTVAAGQEFCVGDVDLLIGTGGGHAEQLVVELRSPAGQLVRVWDHHGEPGSDLSHLFDDDETPPPTGERMSAFNAAPGAGTWELRVVDGVPGDVNRLFFWELFVTSAGQPPCTWLK